MNELERLQPNTDDITETAKRMSEVKRYGFEPIFDHGSGGVYVVPNESSDGKYIKFTDYESERLAHEETKAELVKYQDAFVRERERFEHEEHDHSLTEKRLEELEDANQKLRELYYTERKDLAQFREYADTYYPDLWDCFENSRARSKS